MRDDRWVEPQVTTNANPHATNANLQVTTNAERICALLDPMLAADPVRYTVLGWVRTLLASGQGDGWCAVPADGRAMAVRSGPETPIVITGDDTSIGPLIEPLRALPSVAGITGTVDVVDAVVAAWGVPHHRIAERLFRLDQLAPPAAVLGSPRSASTDDRALLMDWYMAFAGEAHDGAAASEQSVDRALAWGRIWLWTVDGRPVAMAGQRPPVVGVARIGPVYTPPAYRRRGFGSAVTATATRDVQALGGVPVLFTDIANPVSNAIYQRLGYRAVGDYAHVSLR